MAYLAFLILVDFILYQSLPAQQIFVYLHFCRFSIFWPYQRNLLSIIHYIPIIFPLYSPIRIIFPIISHSITMKIVMVSPFSKHHAPGPISFATAWLCPKRAAKCSGRVWSLSTASKAKPRENKNCRALWISWGTQRKPRKTSKDRGDRDIMGIVCKKLPNYKTKPGIGRKGYNGKIMMEFENSSFWVSNNNW